VGFILAHEYSHTFQFKMVNNRIERLGSSTPQIELQADVLAGYYGGARLDEQLNNEAAIRRSGAIYIRAAGSLGDYAFFSNSHHGTPTQRALATRAGFNAGRAKKFGDLDDAFGSQPTKLFEWSKVEVNEILK
jgi:predicted metalloprotease